jgi:shikimate dehydrogenase
VSADAQPFVLAGVMGWPVAHSRSPLIHGHWIAQHGLRGAYVPLAVQAAQLEQALRALPVLGFAGCNLTIPHKVPALSFVDHLDPIARRIGAVNTLVVQPDGSLRGTNTDAFGYIESLREAQPTWAAGHGPALVLGAGGASRAVLCALIDAGVPLIRLCNRDAGKAQALAQEFGPRVQALPWSERHAALQDAQLLVNTTSLGMQGQDALDIRLDALPAQAVVSDIVYVPRITPLLAAAQARGNPIVEGLGMLLHQARPAFAAWFGPLPAISETLLHAVRSSL